MGPKVWYRARLAAGGGWCASSEDVLEDGVALADSCSRGSAVEGDGRGEASESDEESLPEMASDFLLEGDADTPATKEGEAITLSATVLSKP